MDEMRLIEGNPFGAAPNIGLTDTIIVPISAHTLNSQLMTLISQPQPADALPTQARLVIFEEDNDVITVNTDLKGWVSRDGGTTYTQITLIEEGFYDTVARILSGTVDISGQPSGTNMVYKITSHNNKGFTVHGTGMLWS
jgi:hypothetical protein